MIKWILIFTFLILFLFNGFALSFDWCIQVTAGGKPGGTIISENSFHLPVDEGFKFFFTPRESCYFQIYHYSSEKELTLIFDLAPVDMEEGRTYYRPEKWYGLDEGAEEETIFVIASTKKPEKLDSLYTDYRSRVDKKKDDLKQKRELFDELYNLLGRKDQDTGKVILKPVPITGAIKGQEMKTLFVEGDFYSRMIKIYPLK